MQDDWKEPVGFLCRWCLLALSAGTVVFVTWATLLATSTMTSSLQAELIVSDALCEQSSRPAILRCYFARSPRRIPKPLIMGSAAGEKVLTGGVWRLMPYLRLDRSEAGSWPILVSGLPYGPLAFQRHGATVKVLPPGRRVFLVDWRLAISTDANSWLTCSREMLKRGEVGFLHAGSAEEFHAVRKLMLQRHPDANATVSFVRKVDDADDVIGRLGEIARDLNPDSLRRQRSWLITSDASLAANATKHFEAHLIGYAQETPQLHVHESLAAFCEALSVETTKE